MEHEDNARAGGAAVVAGIDEAGRGPLAGPVMAAAVILPPGFRHGILTDSKQLSPARREALHAELCADPSIHIGRGEADVREIDRLNILRATHLAMERAVRALALTPDFCLIDGLAVPRFPWPHAGLVKGDSLSLSIAAASIIAKVERDRFMTQAAAQWPQYAFEVHKGYGTALHLQRLREHGPCPLHRQSFQPIAQLTLDL